MPLLRTISKAYGAQATQHILGDVDSPGNLLAADLLISYKCID